MGVVVKFIKSSAYFFTIVPTLAVSVLLAGCNLQDKPDKEQTSSLGGDDGPQSLRPSADLDNDCVVSDQDVISVLLAYRNRATLSDEAKAKYDLHKDGKFDLLDLEEAVAQIDSKCKPSFRMFQGSGQPDATVVEHIFKERIGTSWPCYFLPEGHCNDTPVVDIPRIRAAARMLKDQGTKLAYLDIESLNTNPLAIGTVAAAANRDKLVAIISTFRDEFSKYNPEVPSPDICYYSVVPDSDFYAPQTVAKSRFIVRLMDLGFTRAEIIDMGIIPENLFDWQLSMLNPTDSYYIQDQNWRNWNTFMKPLADASTALCPRLYMHTSPDDAHPVARRQWDGVDWGFFFYARENLSEARRLADGKKLYPFLWPVYHNSNWPNIVQDPTEGYYITKNQYRSMLNSTYAGNSDGMVHWDGGSTSWNVLVTYGFYHAYEEFFAETIEGRANSTGN